MRLLTSAQVRSLRGIRHSERTSTRDLILITTGLRGTTMIGKSPRRKSC
jgi:hypothetical protein